MVTKKCFTIFSLFLLLSLLLAPVNLAQAAPAAASNGDCRFGIDVSGWTFIKYFGVKDASVGRYDLTTLGVGYYLDWLAVRNPKASPNVRYTHVLRTSDKDFPVNMNRLPNLVATYKGDIWVIGNEPDQPNEDGNTAETYADRFYAYASYIKSHDPSAIMTFGTLTSVTRLRMRYLDYAWAELVKDAGSQAAAYALADVFSPHMYVLNEGLSDGVRIPPAISQAVTDEYISLRETITGDQIISVDKFKERLTWMREWMQRNGLQNKNLWVTEYGNLLPPINMPGTTNLTSPFSVTIDYMNQTFDYMYSTKDQSIGNPNDNYRLVQKWFWFSLNDLVFHFGGTLIDPLTLQDTPVGTAFRNYNPPFDPSVVVTPPDFSVTAVSVTPLRRTISNHNRVDYVVKVRVHNNVVNDFTSNATVSLTENGNAVGTGSAQVARCGGDGIITLNFHGGQPGVDHTFHVTVSPVGNGNGSSTDITVPATQFTWPHELFMPTMAQHFLQ